VPSNDEAFLNDKHVHLEKDVMPSLYHSSTLWLDKPPTSDFYFRFDLHKEMSYNVKVQSRHDMHKYKSIKIFSDKFNSSAEVLHLEGLPHQLKYTPYQWSSLAGVGEALTIWKHAIVYPSEVQDAAMHVQRRLNSRMGSYACLHLRRGDFTELGWNGLAASIKGDADFLRAHIRPGETLYLATNEVNSSTLAPLLALGHVKRWEDVKTTALFNASKLVVSMAAFGDYVSLIEQSICARARVFYGSQRSSWTGHVWNLRLQFLGDTRTLFLIDHVT
jgi:hypothetical protein